MTNVLLVFFVALFLTEKQFFREHSGTFVGVPELNKVERNGVVFRCPITVSCFQTSLRFPLASSV